MLAPRSIKWQLTIATGSLLVVFAIVTSVSLYIIEHNSDLSNTFVYETLPVAADSNKLALAAKEVLILSLEMESTDNVQSLHDIYSSFHILLQKISILTARLSDSKVEFDLLELNSSIQKLRTLTDLIYQLKSSQFSVSNNSQDVQSNTMHTSGNLINLKTKQLKILAQKLSFRSENIMLMVAEKAHLKVLKISSSIKKVRSRLHIVLLVISCVALIISWLYVTRRITNRLSILSSSISNLDSSELQTHIIISGVDEIAQMARSTEKLLENRVELLHVKKYLESRVTERTAALQNEIVERNKSEERLRALIENIPGVSYHCTYDKQIIIEFISSEIEELTGYKSSDFINNKVRSYASIIHPEDVQYVNDQVASAIENHIPFAIEYRIINVTGEIHWVYERGQALFDDDTLVCLDGVIVDISEKKNTDKMIIQSEKLSSIAGLAAGMAHEINNPLAIISLGLENIFQRINPDLPKNVSIAKGFGIDLDQLQDFFIDRKIISFMRGGQDAVERAAEIVKNMLLFSRKSETNLTVCDIENLIEKTIQLGASAYDRTKKYDFKFIDIIKEYDDDLPAILCCSSEIEQVLLNLFKNALQAMEEVNIESHQAKFHIRLKKELDYLRIEVEDNGPGMSEAVKKRIFEPFFTTKAVGVGTGLGLSVSYSIITQNHSGTFTVESQQASTTNNLDGIVCGKTKFTIRLPVK